MQEARWARFGIGFARAQIPIIGQDDTPLLVIYPERTLRRRVGEVIQRRIDSRCDEKKTDGQEDKSF